MIEKWRIKEGKRKLDRCNINLVATEDESLELVTIGCGSSVRLVEITIVMIAGNMVGIGLASMDSNFKRWAS